MRYNFRPVSRDQEFLLPENMRQWLPEDHQVWLLLAAVAQFDMSAFLGRYRPDGHGRAAYDPTMMVALLLFAYCEGFRSSRDIQRRCERDVAYRVITGNEIPDHATIARFLVRHRDKMAELFVQVLLLCAKAGLVRVGTIALDGTKLRGNASTDANRTRDQLDEEIEKLLREATDADRAEDALFGPHRRGDEPPAGMSTFNEQMSTFAKAKNDTNNPPRTAHPAGPADPTPAPARADPTPAPAPAPADPTPAPAPAEPDQARQRRLRQVRSAANRLDELQRRDQAAQDKKIADREAAKAAGTATGRRPALTAPKRNPPPRANTTDPDSSLMKGRHGFLQGYNGQIVVGKGQIIIAAGLTNDPTDYASLHPMLDQALANLDKVGVTERVEYVLADAGYGGKINLSRDTATGAVLLIPPTTGKSRTDTTPPKDPAVAAAAERLNDPENQARYRQRSGMVEPVFGQLQQRGGAHLTSRGHPAALAEWLLRTSSHNLGKLMRHQQRTA